MTTPYDTEPPALLDLLDLSWSPEWEHVAPAVHALLIDIARQGNVRTDAVADTGKYKYTYASLGELLDAVRPIAADHDLVILTPTLVTTDSVVTRVSLLHSSLQSVAFPAFTLGHRGSDPQTVGSLMSYLRRYAILASFNLATEDDDGQYAQAQSKGQQNRPQPSQSRPPAQPAQNRPESAQRGSEQMRGRPASPPAQPAPPRQEPAALDAPSPNGPPAPRTEHEANLREVFAGLSNDELKTIKAAFRTHFGCPLLALDPEHHEEAEAWVHFELHGTPQPPPDQLDLSAAEDNGMDPEPNGYDYENSDEGRADEARRTERMTTTEEQF